jgi:transposase
LDKREGKYAAHQVYDMDMDTGEIKKQQVVHIVQPQNVGESLCIDEKMIHKRYTTIVSNQKTGKIALLIDSVKPALVKQAIGLLGKDALVNVKHVSSDMSPSMKKICADTMPQANIVIDKFHVIKHIMEALNQVRLEIKNEIKHAKIINRNNPNEWTDVELLEKVRYLLFKMEYELDEEQKQLLKFVFNKYSVLQTAYDLVQTIRMWYHKNNIGKPLKKLSAELYEWIQRVRDSNIKAFKFVIKMFYNHWDDILRYFEKGLTNAKAENLNGKIQRFFANNYGIRDRDFFLYRVQIYFAIT